MLKDFKFADYLAMVAKTKKELKTMLDALSKTRQKYGKCQKYQSDESLWNQSDGMEANENEIIQS